MLEAIPTNIFSSNFRLQQNDNLLGEVEASIWRDRAVLEIGEGTYQLYWVVRWREAARQCLSARNIHAPL